MLQVHLLFIWAFRSVQWLQRPALLMMPSRTICDVLLLLLFLAGSCFGSAVCQEYVSGNLVDCQFSGNSAGATGGGLAQVSSFAVLQLDSRLIDSDQTVSISSGR